MPILTERKTQPQYDVIVVGSGAGGGMAAMILALNGVKVLMIEAGRNYEAVKETPMFNTPEMAPLRGAATPDRPFGFYDSNIGGWQVAGEPYTNKAGTEGEFWWWRARMLGGRTNHWGRISLRFGEFDFKPKARDGLGVDWPIDYTDIAPWYDRVEQLIGVYGENDGIANAPNSSPGVLQPPPKPRVGELLAKKSGRKIGVPVVAAHRAVLSQPLDWKNLPKVLFPNNPKAQEIIGADMMSRAACFWATNCIRGCSIRANFQSTTVLLPPALATGNLDIITDAMVREVVLDDSGKATGVHYIDKITRRDAIAKARVVILAASTCETSRILLNSKSRDKAGLANSSGQVGRNLMDSVGTKLGAHIPAMEDLPPYNEDGAGGLHTYVPWWLVHDHAKPVLRAAITSRWAAVGRCRRPRASAISIPPRPACMAASSRKKPGATTARSSASPAAVRCCRTRTATRSLIRRSWINGASPCCAFTGSGAITRSSRPDTCSRPLPSCSKAWVARPRR